MLGFFEAASPTFKGRMRFSSDQGTPDEHTICRTRIRDRHGRPASTPCRLQLHPPRPAPAREINKTNDATRTLKKKSKRDDQSPPERLSWREKTERQMCTSAASIAYIDPSTSRQAIELCETYPRYASLGIHAVAEEDSSESLLPSFPGEMCDDHRVAIGCRHSESPGMGWRRQIDAERDSCVVNHATGVRETDAK